MATEATRLLDPQQPQPEDLPTSPPSPRHRHRHDRTASSINEILVDVLHDVEEYVEDIAHDLVTFEPLDEAAKEKLLEAAEEQGVIEALEDLNSEQAEEVIEEFLYPDDPMDPFVNDTHEKLGILPQAILVFYNVSGGPFGVETSVRAGGNAAALLGFLIMPLVWSLPEALMTAELGTAFPEASGGVAWVEEAYGESAGWMAGYLGWIAGATDNAIYPVLFLDYLLNALHSSSEDINPFLRFSFLSMASIGLGYVNWRGLPLVGKLSTWICLLAMSPFIIMILVGAWKVDPSRLWFQNKSVHELEKAEQVTDDDVTGGFFPNAAWGGILWRPFLNNLFWNLNSFDAAGSFAGEIDDPGRGFPRAMFLGVFLVAICYFFPLLVAIGASGAEQHEWVDGFLAQVTAEVVGPWLGAWTVFAAAFSNIALFQAELSADAFQLMGMADRGHVPVLFGKRSRHGTPTNGIILGTAVIVGLGVTDFEQLIEMLNFNYSLALLMEYAAFIKLRVTRPDLERPYRVPLGTFGCILLITPTICVTVLVMALATYTTLFFVFVVSLVGAMSFCAKRRSERVRKESAVIETTSAPYQ